MLNETPYDEGLASAEANPSRAQNDELSAGLNLDHAVRGLQASPGTSVRGTADRPKCSAERVLR